MNYMQAYGQDALVNSFYAPNIKYNKLASTSRSEKRPYILTKFDIPPFSGKYEEWKTFKDLFEQLIDLSLIPDAQRQNCMVMQLPPQQVWRQVRRITSLHWLCWIKYSTTKEQC